MKVFVAGATGVLGRRAVAQLRAAGVEVTGIARSRAKQAMLDELGATPIEVSLFDRQALTAAVAGRDVVCNLATAIPTGERAGDRAAWEVNDRIRREGSRNLVDAALESGAGRYVQESISSFLYAEGGDAWLDEDAAVDTTWITDCAIEAEANALRFADQGGTGVALRFGVFYGADSGHTAEAVAAARAGAPAELGPPDSVRSSVTTDDAASAVVAALEAPSGIYNVADDEPLRRSEYVEAMTRALGIPPLAEPTVTPELPPDFSMLTRSIRVPNRRFKEATGWRPRCPSAREGWQLIAAELSS